MSESTSTTNTLSHEADIALRGYIVKLADTCIMNKYKGIECELATYLAARVYDCVPADLRPAPEPLEQVE